MNKVYEIVRYKAKDTVKDETILLVSKQLNDLVAAQPGLISRTLSKSEDGEWIDIVLWQSFEQALKAAEIVNNNPVAGEFMTLIEEPSVNFTHYELKESY